MLAKLYDNTENGLGLKNWLEIGEADSQYDSRLTGLLKAVSGRFEGDCKRLLRRQENVEEIHDGGGRGICLRTYPIESIASVKESYNQDWDNAADLVEKQAWVAVKKAGVLYRMNFPRWRPGVQTVRVIVTGGYVLPAEAPLAGQIVLPVEIQFAILEQCRFLWQRRGELGIGSAGAGGGSWEIANKEPWLSSVQRVLNRYKMY